MFEIITFYEFKRMSDVGSLADIQDKVREVMHRCSLKGTVILAEEGYNSTVCGQPDDVRSFVDYAEEIFNTRLTYKSSFHDSMPFRRVDVKIKPEIVTLKQSVDIEKGKGTHLNAKEWNRIISDPETIVLDTRNDYEYQSGTFRRAVNPGTEKFSDLPAFVESNLDPERNRRIAVFCTGGIRCEKFAPYLIEKGFREVFQLEGGILKYLESVDSDDSLWEGECFVFDERVTVDHDLKKGYLPDLSQSNSEMAT